MEIVCYATGRNEHPENSIAGIRHCLEVNPEWRIEMDIQMTKDHELVLFHDDSLKRTTGAIGKLRDHTYEELLKFNIGFDYYDHPNEQISANDKIPLFADVIEQFPNGKFLFDLHSYEDSLRDVYIKKVAELLSKSSILDFVIVSQDDQLVSRLKILKPQWQFGASAKEAKKLIFSSKIGLDSFFLIQSDILMIPIQYWMIRILTKRIINHVKKRNRKIWVWAYEGETVKTIDNISKLKELKELGVDGIFTDCPLQLYRGTNQG